MYRLDSIELDQGLILYLKGDDAVLVENEVALFQLELRNLSLLEERPFKLLVGVLGPFRREIELLKDKGTVLAIFLLLKDRGVQMLPFLTFHLYSAL